MIMVFLILVIMVVLTGLLSLRKKKPIIISFGNITDKNMYQAVGGYMLRKLFELSNRYFDVYLRNDEIKKKLLMIT